MPRSRRLALATGLTYHLLEWDHATSDHTVVLVHGFLDLAWAWQPVAERLAERYHVIAPDLRGHGDSDWIGAGGYYHFFDYVADLDDVVTRAGRARVSLVGHSMGGSVTSYLAGTRPERIHRLALLEGLGPPETTANAGERTARWIDAWKAARQKAPRIMTVAEAAARIRKNDALLSEDDALFLAGHGTRAVTGGVTWKHDPLHLTAGPYLYRVDVAESLWRRVREPVLYLDGARSLLRLPDAEIDRRLAAFPGATRRTIADAGHAMQRHQPAAVADALIAHLGA